MVNSLWFLSSTLVFGDDLNHKNNVLIIHSYHQNFLWTKELQEGIETVLTADKFNLFIEHLDTYRFGEQIVHQKALYLVENYSDRKIDAIIVTDNDAYNFIKSNNKQFSQDIPVIFLGLNNIDVEKIDTEHYTGIMQNTDIAGFIKMAKEIHPSLSTIHVVGADTNTARKIYEEFEAFNVTLKEPLRLNQVLGNSFSEITNKLDGYNNDNAIIYVAGSLGTLNHNEFSTMIESSSNLPTYVGVLPSIDGTVMGGYVIDPVEHGAIAGQMAYDIIDGTPIEGVPIITDYKQVKVFNYYALTKYKIAENSLPMNSTIINKAESTIIIDRLTLSILISLLALSITIVVLLSYSIRIKGRYNKELLKAKKALQSSNDELQAYTEELLASQEELDRQFNEVQDKKQQIQKLADYDQATGLYNVQKFKRIISEKLKGYEKFYIIYLTITNIESMSYSLGYMLFESVLKNVSEEIQMTLGRKNHIYALINGDNILICGSDNHGNLEQDLFKINMLFNNAFYTDYFALKLEAKMGIAYPTREDDATTLIRNAAIASVECKQEKHKSHLMFEPIMKSQLFEMQKLQAELDVAILENQFIMHYQPKYALDGETIIGYEALIRWQLADGSLRYPDSFIPAAELSGKIVEISRIVIELVCETIAIHNFEERNQPIAINLSPQDFEDNDLIHFLTKTIDRYGIKRESLELEITETSLITDIERANTLLAKLMSLGFVIALDDFGTGYSSLSYLRNLPISKIKIDKRFIDNIGDANYMKILKAIVQLSNELNYQINIEGVETQEQFELLKPLKPDELQGYLFSKPKPLKDII